MATLRPRDETACRNHILTAFGTQSSPQHALRGWLAPGFSRRSDETARQPCLCSSQHDLILGSSSSTPLDVIMFFLLPTSHLHLVVSFSLSLFPVLPISFFPSNHLFSFCRLVLLSLVELFPSSFSHPFVCSLISCFSCGLVSVMFPLRVVRFF